MRRALEHGDQIGEAVEDDGAVDARVDAFEAGLEARQVGREREQRRQVTARRATDHGDVIGARAVLGAVLPDPGQRGLAILDGVGQPEARRQAVQEAKTVKPAAASSYMRKRDWRREPMIQAPPCR